MWICLRVPFWVALLLSVQWYDSPSTCEVTPERRVRLTGNNHSETQQSMNHVHNVLQR